MWRGRRRVVRGEVKEIILGSLMKGCSPFKEVKFYLKARGIKIGFRAREM